MERRRYLRTVGTVTAMLGVAGCTGDDDQSGTDSTPTPTPTDDDGSTPTASETSTRTPKGTPPSNPAQRVAVGDGLRFDPEQFEISVGDTVLWEWIEGGHNIKYDEGDVPDGTTWTGTEGSRTTTYGKGHEHWHTFEVAGEYNYYCVPHRSSGMTGGFTVRE